MTETEPKKQQNTPQTLKSQIHAKLNRLSDPDVILLGSEGACPIYEDAFGLMCQWVECAGTPEEKENAQPVIAEFDKTRREKVYSEVSTLNYQTLYKLTIDHIQSTHQHATDASLEETVKEMKKITWDHLKVKRMSQFRQLRKILKRLTDADEDVGSQFKSSRDII
ncbi:MAG: hypothetical protein PHT77_10295 [Bacteroidales bacterium]|nr:hypothetical protein [Bacteroidales bacterium]